MAKEPMTNKYGSKFTHKGVEVTWNAETKSLLSKDEAADFYVEANGAAEKFVKSLQPKKGLSPVTKAFFFMIGSTIAIGIAKQVFSLLFCDDRWCW